MCNKLWFLMQNDSLLNVFDEEEFAVEMKLFHIEENPFDDFYIECIQSDRLAKYPEEFDFARNRGFLHD